MEGQKVRSISWQQYRYHISEKDCWILIQGNIYDMSSYLNQHPGGQQIILDFAGVDATKNFLQAKHSEYAIIIRDSKFIGRIQKQMPQGYLAIVEAQKKKLKQQSQNRKMTPQRIYYRDIQPKVIPLSEINKHNKKQDCWIIFQNKIYDMTQYLILNPQKQKEILKYAGKDCTLLLKNQKFFDLAKLQQYFVGNYIYQIEQIKKVEKVQNSKCKLSFFFMIIIGLVIGSLVYHMMTNT